MGSTFRLASFVVLLAACPASDDGSTPSPGDAGESSTGGSSGPNEAESTGTTDLDAQEEAWAQHCEAITAESECTVQRMQITDETTASCSWVEWSELVTPESCEVTPVFESSCVAVFYRPEEEPYGLDCGGTLTACQRDSGDSILLGLSSAGCGPWSGCTANDEFCECACQLKD